MTDSPPQVLAAIDIGSNSIKLTVARRGENGPEEFFWDSETVRLGAGVGDRGALAEDRMAAGRDTLARFAEEARQRGAARVLAVATEALRVADNGRDFLRRVATESGIEAELIDGDREAALTFAGVAATMETAGSVVVADIGGASTEIIVARDGEVAGARSLPVGSGRLTDRLVVADPPTAAELGRCREAARATLAAGLDGLELPAGSEVRLALVGGTGEYLGKLVGDPEKISAEAIENVLRRLQTVGAADLAVEIEAAVARARVLPAGVAVAAAVVDLTRPASVAVARSGIRTGLLIEAFEAS